MLMEHPILHFLFAQKKSVKNEETIPGLSDSSWGIMYLGSVQEVQEWTPGECQNCLKLSSPAPCLVPSPSFTWQNLHVDFFMNWGSDGFLHTLQGINISHLGKRKIIFKMPFLGDMLVPWRVSHDDGFHDSHQLPYFYHSIFYLNRWNIPQVWV